MQIWSCTPGGGDAAQHFTVTADNRFQWNTAECLDLTGGSLTSGNQVCSFYTLFTSSSSLSDRLFSLCVSGSDVGLRSW
jgi:hypothetical protein